MWASFVLHARSKYAANVGRKVEAVADFEQVSWKNAQRGLPRHGYLASMLIASISGIRGTVGGKRGEGLSPIDVAEFAAGYGAWVWERRSADKVGRPKVVVGRDARISGPWVRDVVCGTLNALGVDVVDLGLSTTPTVEIAVPELQAEGGLILTASHNPKQWNALKLLNEKGEFLSGEDGDRVLALAKEDLTFAEVDRTGQTTLEEGWLDHHVEHVLGLSLVDASRIRAAKLKVAVDAVNSSGGIAVPKLLKALDVEVVPVHCEPTGQFAHNPEPLPQHLDDLTQAVLREGCNLGISVDPDVDRLCFVCEDGSFFGEEYTLVAVADHILAHTPGPTVSNLSSTRALREVAHRHGCSHTAAAVGEVNVVAQMRACDAVIGGEGNGGVIYPTSHAGRDALVGIGLFLTLLVERGGTCSSLRASYPTFHMVKDKMALPPVDVDAALQALKESVTDAEINDVDGVKFDLEEGWVHLRKSNTEPILRIYAEAGSPEAARRLADTFAAELRELLASTGA
jgi:phosphomannomutase